MVALVPAPGLQIAADRAGFGLTSLHATGVDLLLWASERGPASAETMPLEQVDPGLWFREVAAPCIGLAYAYRVRGPWAPERGHRFDPRLRLLDPYAPAVAGLPAHQGGGGLHGVVTAPPPVAAPGPHRPWSETIVYEAHVRGLTMRNPHVPPELRGTYLGLASEPVLEHLHGLGVTAVELLPVQHHVSERRLQRLGLTNYWGYSPVGFFAPHAGYASGEDGRQVAEFRAMVDRLHAAGFEVLLDLVLNHSGEGAPEEPTLSLRGIDNATYYRLQRDDPARPLDWTGCGNTVNAAHPAVARLIVDCARWWAERFGIDGFRLDLAPTLFRDAEGRFDPASPLFAALASHPSLADRKWIAEPWDLAPGGYCAGRFPSGWAEWNDRFRDGSRRFWRGQPQAASELARGLAGSADLFAARAPLASINYVTSHDGFTLQDVVSFERKHNAANGEGNRDGAQQNWSRNWGHEGPTREPGTRLRRRRARECLLASVLLARGVPMLSHGDELGRTQAGNNNAYCHDGPLTWVDWEPEGADLDLRAWTGELARLRRSRPALRLAEPLPATALLDARGQPLVEGGTATAFAVRFGEALILLCNGGSAPVVFAGEPFSGVPIAGTTGTDGAQVDGALVLPGPALLLLERSEPRAEPGAPAATQLLGG